MKLRDVTVEMQRYLEAKRHLWNAYFREEVANIRECAALDDYDQIDRSLFQALVLRRLNLPLLDADFAFGVDPLSSISLTNAEGIDQMPALISGPPPQRVGQWAKSTLDLTKQHTLQFIEFFDWDRYSAASYPLVLARIEVLKTATHLHGHNALLDSFRLRFLTADGPER